MQVTPGVSSEPSPLPVTVWQVTKLLPVPVFLSGVSRCSGAVWLGSLILVATNNSPVLMRRSLGRRPPQLNVSRRLNHRFTPEKHGGCNDTNRYSSSY